MQKLLIYLFGLSSITILTGCTEPSSVSSKGSTAGIQASSDTAPQANSNVIAANEKSDASSTPPTTEIKVTAADHAQLMERIKQFKGKVVVVDVWSTSCLPCMKEFPHLVELARRWPDDVVCISMNVDYIGLPKKPVDSYLPKVSEFLKSVAADPPNMENLLGSEPDSDVLTKLDIEAMPGILIFKRNGDMASKLTTNNAGDDGLTYSGDVVPLVEQLVAN